MKNRIRKSERKEVEKKMLIMTMTMMMEKKASVYQAYGLYSETEFVSFEICDDTSLILFFLVFSPVFPEKKNKPDDFYFHDGLAADVFAFALLKCEYYDG